MQSVSDIIDVQSRVLEELAVGEDTPIINVKRTVTVVYSTDSMLSIAAAGILSTLVEDGMDVATAQSYDVKFIEVTALDLTTISDAYLWLGMEKMAPPDIHPNKVSAYNDAQHSSLTKSFNWDLTHWDEEAASVFNSFGKFIHRDKSLMTAVSRLSGLIPELKFSNVWNLVQRVNDIAGVVDCFNSQVATPMDIIKAWVMTNRTLKSLGASYHPDSTNPDADKVLAAYYEQRKSLMGQITASAMKVVEFDGELNRILMTSIPENFWVARRLIGLTGAFYHNIRLSIHGTHVKTDLPEAVASKYVISTARSATSH